MKQLFELGCAYSSEELSLNKMLGQLQDAGNVTTLASYLTTLDESRLLCGLNKYASDNARKYNSVPKLMVYNTALFSVQSGMTFNLMDHGVGSTDHFSALKIWMFENKFVSLPSHLKTIEPMEVHRGGRNYV